MIYSVNESNDESPYFDCPCRNPCGRAGRNKHKGWAITEGYRLGAARQESPIREQSYSPRELVKGSRTSNEIEAGYLKFSFASARGAFDGVSVVKCLLVENAFRFCIQRANSRGDALRL